MAQDNLKYSTLLERATPSTTRTFGALLAHSALSTIWKPPQGIVTSLHGITCRCYSASKLYLDNRAYRYVGYANDEQEPPRGGPR